MDDRPTAAPLAPLRGHIFHGSSHIVAVTLDLTEAKQSRKAPAKRRAWPAVFISVGVHILIFTAVGLIVPHPSFRNFSPDEKPIVVVLLPPPAEPAHPRKSKAASPALQQAQRAALPLPRLHVPPTASPPQVKPSPLPAPAAPQTGPTAASIKPGTSVAPGPLPAEDNPRGVTAMLRRSAGCDYSESVHLTEEEREACAKRIGEIRKSSQPFSFIGDAKRGQFAAQAEADERRRAARQGPNGQPVQSCGGNLDSGCLNEEYKTKIRIP